jgi:hypothetical protein
LNLIGWQSAMLLLYLEDGLTDYRLDAGQDDDQVMRE